MFEPLVFPVEPHDLPEYDTILRLAASRSHKNLLYVNLALKLFKYCAVFDDCDRFFICSLLAVEMTCMRESLVVQVLSYLCGIPWPPELMRRILYHITTHLHSDFAKGILFKEEACDPSTEQAYVFYFFYTCLRNELEKTVCPAMDYFMKKWLMLEEQNPSDFEMLEWMEDMTLPISLRDYYSTLSTEWMPRFPDPVVPTVDDMYEMIQARPDFRASIDECPSSSSYYVP
jgi:hypothetical protein